MWMKMGPRFREDNGQGSGKNEGVRGVLVLTRKMRLCYKISTTK